MCRTCQVLKSFTYALNQVEMQSGSPGYCSMASNENVAASFEGTTLSKRLGSVADVPN